jgi:hypothetical protein
MLLATLTVEPGGVMISKVPGYARAWALHREGHGAAPDVERPKDDAVALPRRPRSTRSTSANTATRRRPPTATTAAGAAPD